MSVADRRRALYEADVALIRAQVEHARATKALLAVEEPDIGAVIRWERNYGDMKRSYTFVAIRTPDDWYITGQRGGKTWTQVSALMNGHNFHIAVEWENA